MSTTNKQKTLETLGECVFITNQAKRAADDNNIHSVQEYLRQLTKELLLLQAYIQPNKPRGKPFTGRDDPRINLSGRPKGIRKE